MKKLIAKFLNAIRDRRNKRRETTMIEVGELYLVKHRGRRDFHIILKKVNDTWVEGHATDAQTMNPLEERIVMRKLCKFTKLGDGKS